MYLVVNLQLPNYITYWILNWLLDWGVRVFNIWCKAACPSENHRPSSSDASWKQLHTVRTKLLVSRARSSSQPPWVFLHCPPAW